jgi:hypothetical protein
MLWRLALHESI